MFNINSACQKVSGDCHFILHFAAAGEKSTAFRCLKCRFKTRKVPLFTSKSGILLFLHL